MSASIAILAVPSPQNLEDLAREYLSDKEKAIFEKKSHPKRRAEWLAGTIAAKNLLGDRKVPILRKSTGQPYLEDSSFHLSIAHSAGYAAAAISQRPVGIDLESVESRDPGWLQIAFAPEEQKRFPKNDQVWTSLWALKEAALKMLGVGLSVDLWNLRVSGSLERPTLSWKGKTLECRSQVFEKPIGYALALAEAAGEVI